MLKFDYKKRVRYGETDMMGYLYYGNYAQLYEIGRVETMRSIGLSYKKLEEDHRIMMPRSPCRSEIYTSGKVR
jgi:acyl-CoA thioester hydrolase